MILALLATVNLTTGQEVLPSSVAPIVSSENNASLNGKAGAILWDYTHGIYLSYNLDQWYSTLRSTLEGQGYSFTTTTGGIHNMNLSPFRIIVICLGSAWNSAYSSVEADSLVAFVDRGGSLLVMGDNTGCPNANLTPVLSRFNMLSGTGGCGDCFTSTTGNPTYTAIFSGVSQACGVATGSISASSPSEVIGWVSGVPLMAGRCETNKGGVLLIGDINQWENAYIGNVDNLQFLVNTFAWLSNPPCMPTDAAESPEYKPGLRISPNPVKDFLSLALPAGTESATLYNAAGIPVARLYAGNNDLRELPEGVYLLMVGDQTRRVVRVR